MRPSLPHRFRTVLLHALLALGVVLSGCGGTTEPTPTIEPTFSSIRQKIFTGNCTTSSCHSTASRRGNLILDSDEAYNNLVGIVPDNAVARSKGLLRVVPGKPDSSFLMIKLTGPATGEGNLMPDGSSGLTTEQIEAVRTWIANGAQRN